MNKESGDGIPINPKNYITYTKNIGNLYRLNNRDFTRCLGGAVG